MRRKHFLIVALASVALLTVAVTQAFMQTGEAKISPLILTDSVKINIIPGEFIEPMDLTGVPVAGAMGAESIEYPGIMVPAAADGYPFVFEPKGAIVEITKIRIAGVYISDTNYLSFVTAYAECGFAFAHLWPTSRPHHFYTSISNVSYAAFEPGFNMLYIAKTFDEKPLALQELTLFIEYKYESIPS